MGGFPAARITDTTAHGGKVVVGFPTVLINNLPASRIGDMHACPMVTGIVPHVGGPFVLGAFNVLVGYVPQSRVTDMLICVGPPDTLVQGSPNVVVGMSGAMGMGGLILSALMAGLANFAGGYPKSVVDSDGSIATEYNSQITITGSPQYQAAVVSDINTFLATPTGQRWSSAFSATGKKLTIQPIAPNKQQNNAFTTASTWGAFPAGAGGHGTGEGSDSTIDYNPSKTSTYRAEDGTIQTQTASQTLSHEMIHGLHNAQGNNLYFNNQPTPYDNEEESQTIGVQGHEDDPITEKSLYEDNGQSYRPDHNSMAGDTYQDPTGQWHNVVTDPAGNSVDTPIDPPPGGGPPNH